MSKFWFRKNHQLGGPARLAETQAVATRQEAYDRAKDATLHLMTALKQWPGFDSTGNINGVIDHTLVNIDRLDDALDDLRDQIDKLRGQQVADWVRRSGHPAGRATVDEVHRMAAVYPSPATVAAALANAKPKVMAFGEAKP